MENVLIVGAGAGSFKDLPVPVSVTHVVILLQATRPHLIGNLVLTATGAQVRHPSRLTTQTVNCVHSFAQGLSVALSAQSGEGTVGLCLQSLVQ